MGKNRGKLIIYGLGIFVILILVSQLVSLYLQPFPIEARVVDPSIEVPNDSVDGWINLTVSFTVVVENAGFSKFRNIQCQSPFSSPGYYYISIVAIEGDWDGIYEVALASCPQYNWEWIEPGIYSEVEHTFVFSYTVGIFRFNVYHDSLFEETDSFTLKIDSLKPFKYSLNIN